jgi:hypothetical protein
LHPGVATTADIVIAEIELRDTYNALITNYAGAVNLSTSIPVPITGSTTILAVNGVARFEVTFTEARTPYV